MASVLLHVKTLVPNVSNNLALVMIGMSEIFGCFFELKCMYPRSYFIWVH